MDTFVRDVREFYTERNRNVLIVVIKMADDIDYFCNNCKEWYLTEGKCPECGKELVPWTIWIRTTAK